MGRPRQVQVPVPVLKLGPLRALLPAPQSTLVLWLWVLLTVPLPVLLAVPVPMLLQVRQPRLQPRLRLAPQSTLLL